MAYTNGYVYSGYYKNMLGLKPYIQNGTVYLDDIRHKEGSQWSSITPGTIDKTGTLSLSGYANGYQKIEIYDNGKLIKTVESGKWGAWSADLSDILSSGTHSFTIKQQGYDFSGGQPINIVIAGNNSVIPVEITQVYDDAGIHQGIIEQGKTTDDARPTFSGKGPANAQVILVGDGNNVIANGQTDKYGNWKITPEFAIADGNHNVRAFVNGEFSSAFNITIDTAPTQYPLEFNSAFDYLTESVIAEHGNTSDKRPAFSGQAEPNTYVYLYLEGSNEPIGGSRSNASGSWTITPFRDLEPGEKTFEVRSNGEFAKFTLNISADLPVQALVIDHLVDGQTYDLISENGTSNDTTPWISGKSEPFTNVILLEDNKFIGYVQADSQGKWFYEVTTELEAGQHSITAQANGQTSEPFTFNIAAPQTAGGSWGWGSFSINELLVDEEAALFTAVAEVEAQEAAAFTLTQADLTSESLSVGVENPVNALTSAVTEEPQYLQFA